MNKPKPPLLDKPIGSSLTKDLPPPIEFEKETWRVADDGTIFKKGITKYANGDVFDGTT